METRPNWRIETISVSYKHTKEFFSFPEFSHFISPNRCIELFIKSPNIFSGSEMSGKARDSSALSFHGISVMYFCFK